MSEISLQFQFQSHHHYLSSSSSSINGSHQQRTTRSLFNNPVSYPVAAEPEEGDRDRDQDQLSLLAIFVTLFRKSLIASCKSVETVQQFSSSMEIGLPTDVRHVAHVTFDRFNGFLGIPSEFEPEIPTRPPSASASVFGVSTDSMQLSFDSRGNIVPTILLMMQRRLYLQGGLQSEGIFRINAENGQEEHVREQVNRGIVPEDVDIHCLAGLIKAWFRELPDGLLDSLQPEEIMEAKSEDECLTLVRRLPATESSLLNWAVNLMADVAEMERFNKMNARNVATVFAPNMTQMDDPLTALVYVVQVMNFLRTLISKNLKDREKLEFESTKVVVVVGDETEPSSSDDDRDGQPVVMIGDVGCDDYSDEKKREEQGEGQGQESGCSSSKRINIKSKKKKMGSSNMNNQKRGCCNKKRGMNLVDRISSSRTTDRVVEAWR